MTYLIVLLSILVGFILFLLLRFLYVRAGFKDRNYAGVQRSFREEIPDDMGQSFLPGSRSSDDSQDAEMELLDSLGQRKRRRLPFSSKKDIKRSYIMDALLDKPRWRDEYQHREW